MFFIKFLFISSILATALAQNQQLVETDFNATAYQGKWFQMFRTGVDVNAPGASDTYEILRYSPSDGKFTSVLRRWMDNEGKWVAMTAVYKSSSKNNSAIYAGEITGNTDLAFDIKVAYTDYGNVSAVVSNNAPGSSENVTGFILVRDIANVPTEALERAYEALETWNIGKDQLIEQKHGIALERQNLAVDTTTTLKTTVQTTDQEESVSR